MNNVSKLLAAGFIAGTLLTGCSLAGGSGTTAQTDVFKQKQAEALEKQKQNEEAKAKRESSSSSGTSSSTASSSSSSSGSSSSGSQTYKTNSSTVYNTQNNNQTNTKPAAADISEDLNGDTFLSKKNLDAAMQLWVSSGPGNFCTYVITRDAQGNDVYHLTRSSKEKDPEGYKEVTGQKDDKDDKDDKDAKAKDSKEVKKAEDKSDEKKS